MDIWNETTKRNSRSEYSQNAFQHEVIAYGVTPNQIGQSFWILLALIAFGLPYLMSLFPQAAAQLYLLSKDAVMLSDEDEKTKHIREVLHKVGLEHPENVMVVSTENTGPTTFGTAKGAVILIPRDLLFLSDPTSVIELTTKDATGEEHVEEITVRDLTEEQRQLFLEKYGTLIPRPEELDFVIGHEGGHILHDDTGRKVAFGTGAIITSKVAIGLYDKMAERISYWTKNPFVDRNKHKIAAFLKRHNIVLPRIKNPIFQGFLAFGIASSALFAVSQKCEEDADLTSASQLHCAKTARELVEKKIKQNYAFKQHNRDSLWASTISTSGNDLTEVLHPPLTKQLQYLSRLEQEQN
jgi:hypothetical protein